MAFVDIYPTSDKAELKLKLHIETIRHTLRSSIRDVWNVPENDIIIMAHHNTVLERDPDAIKMNACPDLVIKINTSDKKQDLAEKLKDKIMWRFNIIVVGISIELWINFFHTWGFLTQEKP